MFALILLIVLIFYHLLTSSFSELSSHLNVNIVSEAKFYFWTTTGFYLGLFNKKKIDSLLICTAYIMWGKTQQKITQSGGLQL